MLLYIHHKCSSHLPPYNAIIISLTLFPTRSNFRYHNLCCHFSEVFLSFFPFPSVKFTDLLFPPSSISLEILTQTYFRIWSTCYSFKNRGIGKKFICVFYRILTDISDVGVSSSRPFRAGWTKTRTRVSWITGLLQYPCAPGPLCTPRENQKHFLIQKIIFL